MSDILTPEELCALLDTCREAESMKHSAHNKAAVQQVKPYDFARPEKFRRNQMKALNALHKKYAADFSAALTELLSIPVEAELLSMEQLSFQEYCASVPETTLYYNVALEPLTSTAFFEFNPTIADVCIDALTGGTGAITSAMFEFTEIDRSIMAAVVEGIIKQYEKAWSPYAAIRAKVQSSGISIVSGRLFVPAEAVIVSSYTVKIGETESMMSICIPASDTETVIPDKPAPDEKHNTELMPVFNNDLLEESLGEVEIECSVILGRATLTLNDIVNLQKGDVFKLDGKSGAPVEVWIDGKLAYEGVAGVASDNVGLRITREIPEQEMLKRMQD